jgi:hypothetical protein
VTPFGEFVQLALVVAVDAVAVDRIRQTDQQEQEDAHHADRRDGEEEMESDGYDDQSSNSCATYR